MGEKLTQAIARKLIADCGRTLVVRDGEFIVKLQGRSIDDKSTNFTNDLQDAVSTAQAEWAREQQSARQSKDDAWYSQTMVSANVPIQFPDDYQPDRPADQDVEDETVVKIEYWWDRTSRNWIIQAKDAQDNQIGAAEYAANKHTLPGALASMQAMHPDVPCVKS
ncbi:MAG: hypothetical protein JWL65_5376 [Gammaproteobacteria bacterium]|nr:hypothetical protein [Gammaproteobacteria bacterium]